MAVIMNDSEISETWKKERIFEAEPDSRKKFMVTFPFPYVNGAMHMGHGYTFTRLDVSARFRRLKGENVLFPFGFHATGEPIAGVASRLKAGDEKQRKILLDGGVPEAEIEKFKEPVYIVNYWKGIFRETLDALGGSIDWRRSFVTTALTPTFSRFIEWQYNTLRKLGYVVQGTHPVIYCPKCSSPTGDHDRLYGEGASPEEYSFVKFALSDGTILPCGTLRPETMYGATNLWLNPSGKYSRILVDGKEEWVVGSEVAAKLESQLHSVKLIGAENPEKLIGLNVKNPVNGKDIPIYPASFVDPSHASGIVVSVPAHAPYDYIALKDHENLSGSRAIEPIVLIETPEYKGKVPAEEICRELGIMSQKDEKLLEDATSKIYKLEFHSGKLLGITGKYSGLSISQAKDSLISDFVSSGWATPFWECSEKVVCRCGTDCLVKILENQWFLKFSDENWKANVKKAISRMRFYPETYRTQFENTVDWLKDKACARRSGLGTPLPWDNSWIVETLSDSVIYMAYYTISHIIKEEGLTPEDLTDEVFDYVFRGGRLPENPGKWLERMKASFEYWYPVDLRGSGKDLVQNHLTFYIFHHVALFSESFWPVSIAANGYVNVEGEKMSKSKGNFVTLREALSKYGSDAVRFSLVYAAEEANDPDWRRSDAESFKGKIDALFESSGRIGEDSKNTPHLEKWLLSRLSENLKKAEEAYLEIKTRSAIQAAFFDSISDLKWYQKRGGKSAETLRTFYRSVAIALSPVTPFASERIWASLGESGLACQVSWPNLPEPDKATIAGENLVLNTLSDCKEISEIYKKDFSKIRLFVSEAWKGKLVTVVNSLRGKPPSEAIKAAMEVPEIREKGGLAAPLIQKILKEPKGCESALSPTEEFLVLSEAANFIAGEMGGKQVIVEMAEGSPSPKARQAMPGKPAILFE